MMKFGWTLAIISFLVLAGCGNSRSEDFAGCEIEAAKLYPHWKNETAPAAEEATDYIFNCMTIKGYVADLSDNICQVKIDWLPRDTEVCYRKRALLERL
jgi:hypothetical protein